MKRILYLFLSLLIVFSLTLSLFSCDRSYDEKIVEKEARYLIEKSLVLNEIYWGKGIPYVRIDTQSAYCEADFFALRELGFNTVEGLKEKTREVFSEGYCNSIFSTAFSSVVDSDDLMYYARYYQKYEDKEQTIPVCIMVYSEFKNLLPDEVTYLYDTLVVTHSEKDVVYVKLNAIVKTKDGKEQVREKIIGLVEEEGRGWRIETSTYVRYNEKQDEYENLIQNKK